MKDFHHLTLRAKVPTPENFDSLLRPPDSDSPTKPHPASSSVHGGQEGCWAELSRLSHYLIKRLGDAGLQLPVQRPPHLQAAVISLRGNIFTNRVPSQPLYQARMTSQSS